MRCKRLLPYNVRALFRVLAIEVCVTTFVAACACCIMVCQTTREDQEGTGEEAGDSGLCPNPDFNYRALQFSQTRHIHDIFSAHEIEMATVHYLSLKMHCFLQTEA